MIAVFFFSLEIVCSGLLTLVSNGFVLYVGLRVKKRLFEKPILRWLLILWPQRYFNYWPIFTPLLKWLTLSSSLAFVDFLTGIICTPVVILTYYFSRFFLVGGEGRVQWYWLLTFIRNKGAHYKIEQKMVTFQDTQEQQWDAKIWWSLISKLQATSQVYMRKISLMLHILKSHNNTMPSFLPSLKPYSSIIS